MVDKIKKTLKDIIYGASIIAITSLISLNDAEGQRAHNYNSHRMHSSRTSKAVSNPNSLYLGVQTEGLGMNAGYGRKISSAFGLYTSLAKGLYRSPFRSFSEEYKKSHVDYYDIEAGCTFYEKMGNSTTSFLTIGPKYSIYDKKHYTLETINEKAFRNLSLEVGAGAEVRNKIGMGFRIDPIKVEGKLYIVIPIRHH